MSILLQRPEKHARPDYGKRAPRVRSVPDLAEWSAADEVAVLCESANHLGSPFRLMPWQEDLIHDILGVRADGRWVARDAAFLVARQNGKGGILHALELAGMFLFDEVKEILHSAHEVKTAKKAYRELRDLIKATPHLHALIERAPSGRVVGFRHSNEDTSITVMTEPGGDEIACVVRFMARSTTSARGFSPQWLIIDEAQICSEATKAALFYATRAQKNPLRVWCGTVPGPTDNGEVFTSWRDIGRAGGSEHTIWAEWSVDPDQPVDSYRNDDRAVVDATPALGHMVDWETVDSERNVAISDEAWMAFCREALSWWPDGVENQPWGVIPQAVWAAAGRDDLELLDPVTFALEVTSDLKRAWIAAAGDGGELIEAVELVEELADSERVVPRLVQLHEEQGSRGVVIDERSPAAVFRADLEAAGVPVLTPKSGDVSLAALAITLGTAEGKVLHPTVGELVAVLDRAVGAAEKKSTRESWWIDRRTAAGPFIATSLALWGHRLPVNDVEPMVW